jgi:ABC-type branched-subunit amino acid transport system substrate-binding protein
MITANAWATLAALAALALALPIGANARSFHINITAGATVRIGFMTPATKVLGDTSVNEYHTVMRFLEEDVNSGPRAALLPNHTLEIVFADTTQNAYHAPYAFEELVDAGVAAVVGPTDYEEMMLSSAYASTLYGVTQVGRSSAASALSDKTKYPFYSRLTGSLSSEATRVVAYLKDTIGWDRVGIFAAIDTDTVEFLDLFVSAAQAQGVEVVQPVQFPLAALESSESLEVYTDLLKASSARVIVTLIPRPHGNKGIELMRLAGLCSQEYTIVLPSVSSVELSDVEYPYVLDALIGAVYIAPVQFSVETSDLFPLADRLSRAMYNETFAFGARGFDLYDVRMDYDSGLLIVQAIDALIQMKQACVGEVEGVTVIPTCQQLFADGSDDASITRLVRTIPLMDNEARTPVFLLPNGDRATVMTVLQVQGPDGAASRVSSATTGRSNLRIPHLIMPDGTVTPGPDALLWQDGTTSVPLDEAVVSYELEQVSPAVFIAMTALAALASVFCVGSVVGTFAYRKLPIMRMSSYRVNCLSGLGGVVLLAPVFLGRLELSGAVCTTKIWLTSVGFTLLFAPMFAKLWRVYRIFGQKQIRAVKVTDAQLFEVVALLLAVDAVMVGAWNAAAPQRVAVTTLPPTPTDNPNLLVSVRQEECDSSLDSVFYPLLITAKAALLVFGSFLAYRTREVKIKALNDAKWIGMSVYTTSLIALLTLPVVFLVGNDSADAIYVLMSGPSVIIVATATALLFVPKLAAVWSGSTDEWVQTEAKTRMTTASRAGGLSPRASRAATKSRASPSGVASKGETAPARSLAVPLEEGEESTSAPRMEMGTLRSQNLGPSSEPNSPMV